MAKIELPKHIQSLSGAMGNFIFRTYNKPDGTTETRMYRNPYRKVNGRSEYRRSTKPTDKELAGRIRFAALSRAYHARRKAGDNRDRATIWQELKQDYDAQHCDTRHAL